MESLTICFGLQGAGATVRSSADYSNAAGSIADSAATSSTDASTVDSTSGSTAGPVSDTTINLGWDSALAESAALAPQGLR